ncbi:hypothetical protein HanPSC8_Chr03g0091111 [Helianthus annuus]|nr:hypothetical protein HanPSC8_Chr03g0091111 [Helianthus annuus]
MEGYYYLLSFYSFLAIHLPHFLSFYSFLAIHLPRHKGYLKSDCRHLVHLFSCRCLQMWPAAEEVFLQKKQTAP